MLEFVERCRRAPYKPHGRDYDGLDCYGFVYLYYRDVLGVRLPDLVGSCADVPLHEVADPVNGCVVYMRMPLAADPRDDRHTGLYWDGTVWHFTKDGLRASKYERVSRYVRGLYAA